jgi:hypothetical protein
MAAQYLLPCECGKTTPIDTSQAGSSVACVCGKQLEVPSLRVIRELTPSDQTTDADKYLWNPIAGLTFAIGVIIALVGGGVAVYSSFYASQMKEYKSPPKEVVDAWIAEVDIDNAPPEELLTMWNTAKRMGLGEHRKSTLILAHEAIERSERYRNIGLIVVACGLAFAGSSFFLRRKVS